MIEKLIPNFASEAEEAQWWFDNREVHADQFVQAYAEGRVRRGGIAQRLEIARKAAPLALILEDSQDVFIERDEDGQFAVRAGKSDSVSAVFATQAEAIAHARKSNPQDRFIVVRVQDLHVS